MRSEDSDGQRGAGFSPPIAPCVRAGNTLYLAGQVAMDEGGTVLAPGNLVKQAEIIFERISEILSAEGASFEDVVKLITYFSVPLDVDVAKTYWGVRRRFFGDHHVASTGVQVVALIDPGCVIEIEAVAVVR